MRNAEIMQAIVRMSALWARYPELRFFQLVAMLASHISGGDDTDPFYIKDEVVLDHLDQMLMEGGQNDGKESLL